MDRLASMVNPRSRITGQVSTFITCVNIIDKIIAHEVRVTIKNTINKYIDKFLISYFCITYSNNIYCV